MSINDYLGKYKSIVLNIVLVISALILSYNFYQDQEKALKNLKQKIEAQGKRNKGLEEVDKLNQKIKEFKKKANKNDVSSNLNTIAKLAKANSVTIASIRPGSKKEFPLYTKYPFSLQVILDKDYNSLGAFISALENDPAIYFVESFEVRSGSSLDNGDSTRQLSASVVVYTISFNR
jgi:Tfp pilus assembly protein PilO